MWLASVLFLSFLFLTPNLTHAVIPTDAQNDFRFALGYLNCDHYPNVETDGSGNSTTGLQTCIDDAFLNALAVYLPCGTYQINDTLRAYEWQNWSGTAALAPDPRNHVIVGSQTAACRPTIRLIANTSSPANFTSAASPRPMLAFRNFLATAAGTANLVPSDPLGLPANYKEGHGNQFNTVLRNVKFVTNTGNAGAIAVAFPSAQMSWLVDVEVDATGGFAGVYGLPGRNSVTGKVTVTGGAHCVGSGAVFGLALDNTNGASITGLTCTGQTGTAIEIKDNVPAVITGLVISKSTTGAPVSVQSPLVIVDGSITLSGGAANILAIDNTLLATSGTTGHTVYLRNVWVSGSTNLLKSSTEATITGSGTWSRLNEYAYTNQYSQDEQSDPTIYPTYPPTLPSGGAWDRFETRSLLSPGGMTGALTLSGNSVPVSSTSGNVSGGPPSDLLSRHVWNGQLPSFEDGPYINPASPSLQGCAPTVVTPGYGQDGDDGNDGADCRLGLQQAIDDAAAAGHNRVVLPRGVIALGACTTGCVNLHKDTKLMGAGPGLLTTMAYKSNWNPTSETYFVTTDSDATGTAYLGFLSLFARTGPFANQFNSFWHWRVGRGSMTMGIEYARQFNQPGLANQPLKLIRFSGFGGGKHYGNHVFIEALDSSTGARVIYAQDTTQPLSLYGQNLEITKTSYLPPPAPPPNGNGEYANANVEFQNVSHARIYGCKREGESPTLIVNDSDNIAIYGCGAMSLNIRPGKNGWVQFTGATSNVLAAVQHNRNTQQSPNGEMMLREAITGLTPISHVLWPTNLSLYKRGTIDDAPFSATPAGVPPTYLAGSAVVAVANQIDMCWDSPDGAAMLPASGATGFTAEVDGGSAVAPSLAVRQGNACYRLTFAGGTITIGTQVVTLSYAPGNVTAGGSGTPAATAFTDQGVTNQLLTPPVLNQLTFAFRSMYGAEGVSGPWYTDTGGSYENQTARFIQGARYRPRFKVTNTGAATTKALTVCVSETIPPGAPGAFTLLTDDCVANNSCFADAPDVANGQPTTQLLTPVPAMAFVPGGVVERATEYVTVTLPPNSETEVEIGAQLKATAAVNNVYQYRLCETDGAPLSAYNQTPQVTVVSKRANVKGGGTSK